MSTIEKIKWRDGKIIITGGTGLIGANLTAKLKSLGLNVFSVGNTRGESRCDLTDRCATKKMFDDVKPTVVFHLAAMVGGIYANNTQKSDFYLTNTLINTNVIAEVQERKIPFVFAMGTGCAYPKRLERQVLYEEDFLDGIPERTNDAYAYSKRNLLVHLKACNESFGLKYVYCIPANIFGPHDNFHPLFSHAVPGLINRFVMAKKEGHEQVKIWGNGTAKRDFLYVEDLIEAMIRICDEYEGSGSINVATGHLVSINDLAYEISKRTGYTGEIKHDMSFPEGQKQRVFNVDIMDSMGWAPRFSLEEGLERTIKWYVENRE